MDQVSGAKFTHNFSRAIFNALDSFDQVFDVADLNEDPLCDQVFAALQASGYVVAGKQRPKYDGASKIADFRWRAQTGEIVFGELKCLWPTWWLRKHNNISRHAAHWKTVKEGLQKLATLTPTEASHVVLWVQGSFAKAGLEGGYDLSGDYDSFERDWGLDEQPWAAKNWVWANRWCAGFFNAVRLWIGARDDVMDWWRSKQVG